MHKYMKYKAPNPSMTTGRLVFVNTVSFKYIPPRIILHPINIDAINKNSCLYVWNNILVRLDTNNPINTTGPTNDVDMDINIDI